MRQTKTLRIRLCVLAALLGLVAGCDTPPPNIIPPAPIPDVTPIIPPEPTPPATPAVQCLVFTMINCPACSDVKREIASLEQDGWKIGDDGDFVFVPRESQPQKNSNFRVRSYPTLVIVKDGSELSRHVGSMSAAKLADWLTKHRSD